MSWLDFANYFLSNQRLHVWSWINRTFSGMVFWWKIWLWVFWPFPFLFLFSSGRESHQRNKFWLAIKGREPLQVMVSFLSLFGCDYSVLFGYLSGPKTLLYNSFIFFRSLIRDFLFSFVFFRSLTGNFFFLLLFLKRVSSSTVSDSSFLGDPTIPFSEGKDGNSHPGSRFMVIWGLGSKGLQNGRTWRMSGCWFRQQLRDKGNVPHYFHDTHATMMV